MDRIDLRSRFPSVYDQGERSTCVAFAVTGAHELARYDIEQQYENLSEEMLHWKCKMIDGDQISGTSFRSAEAAIRSLGQPHEVRWPYDGFRNENDGSYTPPPEATDTRFCFKASLEIIAPMVDVLYSKLNFGQAVAVGIPISDKFLVAPFGRIQMPTPAETFVGGHAILLVGYEEDASHQRWFIFRNSWGSDWGDGGYGYLPCEYVEVHGECVGVLQP